MSPPKTEKSAERSRKKETTELKAEPKERVNLGCGTLLIVICILALLGKFLPHPTRQRTATGDAGHKPPATAAARVTPPLRSAPPRKATPEKPRVAETAAPRPEKSRPTVFNSPWDNSVAQVERYLRKNLYDAASFEAVEWGRVTEDAKGFRVRCTYRSKNLLGMVATQTQTFLLNPRGEVYKVKDE